MSYSKGDTIAVETPFFFAQTSSSRKHCPTCANCAAFIGSSSSSCISCCTEAVYCSIECKQRDHLENGHWLTCSGSSAKSALMLFRHHASTTNDLFHAALNVIATLISQALSLPSSDGTIRDRLLSVWTQFDTVFPSHGHTLWGGVPDDELSITLQDQVHESFTILQLLLHHEKTRVAVEHDKLTGCLISIIPDNHSVNIPQIDMGKITAELLSFDRYSQLLGALDRHLVPLHLEHPMAALARELPGLPSYDDRLLLLRELCDCIPGIKASYAIDLVEKGQR